MRVHRRSGRATGVSTFCLRLPAYPALDSAVEICLNGTGLSLVDRRTGLGIAGMFAFCWVATLLHQLKSLGSGGYDR
jgi:hypothetical protein